MDLDRTKSREVFDFVSCWLAMKASPDQHRADSRSAIVGVVHRWLAAVVEGHIDAFDDLYAGDAAEIKARGSAVRNALRDVTGTVDQIIVEGSNVAWRFTLSGTHVGELAGHAASQRRVNIRGVNFQLIEDGRVAQHWTTVDLADVIAPT